jgi:hypothetical protein
MPFMRRTRGMLLRLVRRRLLSMVLGAALVAPAAWVEFGDSSAPWWLQGASLVVGATGG